MKLTSLQRLAEGEEKENSAIKVRTSGSTETKVYGRMDDLEARIAVLAEKEELAAIRPELDGGQVMAHLELGPGPMVGKALAFLLDVRLDEGMLGEAEVRRRLDEWWASR